MNHSQKCSSLQIREEKFEPDWEAKVRGSSSPSPVMGPFGQPIRSVTLRGALVAWDRRAGGGVQPQRVNDNSDEFVFASAKHALPVSPRRVVERDCNERLPISICFRNRSSAAAPCGALSFSGVLSPRFARDEIESCSSRCDRIRAPAWRMFLGQIGALALHHGGSHDASAG